MTNSIFYLLWILINAATLIGAIYLFIHYTRLINKRIGTFPALIFIVAIIGNINSVSSTSPSEHKTVVLNSADNTGYSTELKNIVRTEKLKNVTLAENKLVELKLAIHYRYDSTKKSIIPLNAYTTRSGFVGGINWELDNISVHKTANNTYSYYVHGLYDWRILGLKIYTQSKSFEGKITLD